MIKRCKNFDGGIIRKSTGGGLFSSWLYDFLTYYFCTHVVDWRERHTCLHVSKSSVNLCRITYQFHSYTVVFHCLIVSFFVDYRELKYPCHQHFSQHPLRNSHVCPQSVYSPPDQKRTSPGQLRRNHCCLRRNGKKKKHPLSGCEHERSSEMLVLNNSYFDDGKEKKHKTFEFRIQSDFLTFDREIAVCLQGWR